MARILNPVSNTETNTDRTEETQWPWLPVELIGQIIQEAWDLPLATEDRVHLYVSLCGVNRTFLDLFIRTALRDVHLMTPQYTEHYLRLIRDRTSTEKDNDYLLPGASKLANTLCRSLTVHVDDLSFLSSRLRRARAEYAREMGIEPKLDTRSTPLKRPSCIRI